MQDWKLPFAEIEVDESLNLRKTYSQSKHEELLLSIPAKGLMQPLTVWEYEPGKFKLVAGFRRARAIRELIEKGTFPPDAAFPTFVKHLASMTEARILNAAADEGHEPVKRFEIADRLDEMLTSGEVPSIEALAREVGMTPRVVDDLVRCRRSLHPRIVQAWKDAPSIEWEIPLPTLRKWANLSMESQEKAFRDYVPVMAKPPKHVDPSAWIRASKKGAVQTKLQHRVQVRYLKAVFDNRMKEGHDLTDTEKAIYRTVQWVLREEYKTMRMAVGPFLSFPLKEYHPVLLERARKNPRDEMEGDDDE